MHNVTAWITAISVAGSSVGTIKLRKSYMTRLVEDVDLGTVSEELLIEWIADRSRHYAPNTLKSMVSTFRAYFAWAQRTGRRPDNPAAGLTPVRVPPGVPKPVPETILAAALRNTDPTTELILLLGAYAGLRRAEIAAVHGHDVTDIGLIVKGKGGRTRVVPIHPRLRDRLKALGDNWAFPSPARPGEHVSPDYIEDRMQKALPPPHTTHSLRHRFATQAYRASKDIRVVQQLLGHSSVATTQVYVQVDEDAMTAAVDAIA